MYRKQVCSDHLTLTREGERHETQPIAEPKCSQACAVVIHSFRDYKLWAWPVLRCEVYPNTNQYCGAHNDEKTQTNDYTHINAHANADACSNSHGRRFTNRLLH